MEVGVVGVKQLLTKLGCFLIMDMLIFIDMLLADGTITDLANNSGKESIFDSFFIITNFKNQKMLVDFNV